MEQCASAPIVIKVNEKEGVIEGGVDPRRRRFA